MSDVILSLVAIGFWLNAVIYDAQHTVIGWLLVDILIPPLGVLRGIYLLFTT